VSDVEWWLEYGWYQHGVEDFLVALVLASAWLLIAADVYGFHRTRDRRGRGLLVSVPILMWALLACRQAINTTQIDMVGGHSHYPHFLWCILASGLAGLVLSISSFVTDRLLAGPGPYNGPCRGVMRCNVISLAVWLGAWTTAFGYEASL
jgi:hypothetical protein